MDLTNVGATSVQEGLRNLRHKVLTSDTGSRALEIYAAEIDCVLLDLILPEISGREGAER